MIDKRLATVLAVVFAVSLIFAVTIGTTIKDPDRLQIEAVKYLLQLAIVVVVGGIVGALFKLQEQNRQNAQFRAQVYEDYIARLGEQYRSVKQLRRTLRAAGLSSIGRKDEFFRLDEQQFDIYVAQMKLLGEVQLKLEGIMIEAMHLPILRDTSDIAGNIHLMEDYLRRILAEYEAVGTNNEVRFTALKRLDEFTGKSNRSAFSFDGELALKEDSGNGLRPSEYRFLTSFWAPYDAIIVALSRLHPGAA